MVVGLAVVDEAAAPAIYNIIRDESWISVISAFGGQVFYDEAVMIADEVAGGCWRSVLRGGIARRLRLVAAVLAAAAPLWHLHRPWRRAGTTD